MASRSVSVSADARIIDAAACGDTSAKVVVLGPLPFDAAVLRRLAELGAQFESGAMSGDANLRDALSGASVVVTDRVAVPAAVLRQSAVRFIVATASQAEWLEAGLVGTNVQLIVCPGYGTNAVAEFVFAGLFALARQLVVAASSMERGEWLSGKLQGFELAGKSMGVIGRGRIGSRVCEIADAFGMRTVSVTSRSSRADVDRVVASADVLVLAMPSTTKTRHALDARRLRLMSRSAVVVNVGRGDAVDDDALFRALDEGRLAGAVLDVFDNEPLIGRPGSKIMRLASHPRVFATPHIGYDTVESNHRLAAQMLAAVETCLRELEGALRG